MAVKKEIKDTGKNIGHAFKNFGKAMATTFKVTFSGEEKTDENGNSKIKESWKNTGHGFKDAGKSIGTTTKHVFKDDEKKESKEVNKDEAIDVESQEKEEKPEEK